ncbi:aldo/keto reductase [Bengtsoniella intestinalis]|uniref:aldo/keto reductase n=1 Tax=Bengtsoniella intestinalis TaxID=3073143 RepID=UPI00391F5698
MRYQEFGTTGMQFSELSLGTWGIGGAGWGDVDEATRLDAIVAAIECGINTIDTAPAYNAGVAECYVGRAVEALGCRDKVHIITKCGNTFVDGAYVRDGRRDAIKRQCQQSLENLRTDYIDLYLVHWPDPKVPLAETITTLQSLKEEGIVRHVGVSNFTQAQMEEASQLCQLEAYQGQFSMVHPQEQALMQWCQSQRMGVMTYGSMGAGILTGAQRTLQHYADNDNRSRFYKFFTEPMFSKVMDLLGKMDVIAAQRQVPLSQIALNWVAQKDFVSNTIVGAQHRHKIQENAQAFTWTLTPEELAILDAAVAVANSL